MFNRSGSHVDNCFTLVELLVVISIIAILASLLMPTLKKTVGSAKIISCSNNIKHQGAAAVMYSIDSSDYLVPAYYNSTFQITWDDILGDYDGRNLTDAAKQGWLTASNYSNTIYKCPSYPQSNGLDANGDLVDAAARCFSLNGTSNTNGFNGENGVGAVDSSGNCYLLKASVILSPSRVFYIVEYPRRASYLGRGSNSIISGRSTYQLDDPRTMQTHNGIFNYLFCDGHVSSMNAITTEVPCLWKRKP